jgi:hypothetical protein
MLQQLITLQAVSVYLMLLHLNGIPSKSTRGKLCAPKKLLQRRLTARASGPKIPT